MSVYYEDTNWYGDGVTHGCPGQTKTGFEEERALSEISRRIERATFSQMQNIAGGRLEIDIDQQGIVRWKVHKKLTREESIALDSILGSYRNGTYARHQFRDYTKKTKPKEEVYSAWFDEAKENYLYTIPFKQLLSISDYDEDRYYIGDTAKLFELHSPDEVTCPVPGLDGYEIFRIKGALDCYLEPFVLLSLIGKDTHVEEINKKLFAVCTTEKGNKLAASLSSKNLYNVCDDSLKLIGNSYEFLFKSLRLPIGKVLSTAIEVRNPLKLPGEGLWSYSIDEKIRKKIIEATRSPEYEEAKKYTKIGFYKNWYN